MSTVPVWHFCRNVTTWLVRRKPVLLCDVRPGWIPYCVRSIEMGIYQLMVKVTEAGKAQKNLSILIVLVHKKDKITHSIVSRIKGQKSKHSQTVAGYILPNAVHSFFQGDFEWSRKFHFQWCTRVCIEIHFPEKKCNYTSNKLPKVVERKRFLPSRWRTVIAKKLLKWRSYLSPCCIFTYLYTIKSSYDISN